ncbi:MAG: M14 family metallopeptidase [Planctomycetota bacterium]|nr:M14 family metallopeptidase [Planctomycetota bacterium]
MKATAERCSIPAMRTWLVLLAAFTSIDVARAQSAAVTTPEAHLGHALAADFTLPDWNTVRGYFEKLDGESPRVVFEKLGSTAEGRDFVLATISSEANVANLAALKRYNALLADPRGATPEQRSEALEQGRVFLCISNAMHATECAAPQFAMQFAYELATSDAEPWKSTREQCVVLVIPCTNPDGLDLVSDWYKANVGTPFEATELTRLYQLYAGHDNNRDWFTLTQPETRLVTKLLYETWRPQVYWDVHQMGARAERMFVPPFRDPLNPNLDPGIITAINLLGTRAQLDMTREGRTGVASGGTFDMWWNGGNRNVPVRHNIVGLLTEAASCKLATPIFQQKNDLTAPDGVKGYVPSNKFPTPWPGGWWRLASIVDYEMSFARSLIGSLARERRFFLENALEAADRTLAAGRGDGVQAWIIPADQRDRGATRRLADVLIATGIELHVADAEVSADGRLYPKGSIVIRRDQPYGSHVKDLFEVQRYPAGDPPYDVAGWTLPSLFGVRRVEVNELVASASHRVRDADEAVRGIRLDVQAGEARSARDSDAWKSLFSGLAAGKSFAFETRADVAGRFVANSISADAFAIARMPRIGLYSPWSGDMDEGWMRWVFDTFGVKYTIVRNEMLRAGALGDFLDVLVLPGVGAGELDKGRASGSVSEDFTGGLDPEGAVAVEEFVRTGGSLVAVGASTKWAIELMNLPVVDVTAAPEAKEFSCPGSVLRTVPGTLPPFTTDLDESIAVFFSRGLAFREMTEKERIDAGTTKRTVDVVLRYAPTRLLMSGWIQKPELIEDRAAWARVGHGTGNVHLFGFRPQYRGWSHAAFQLLFRAIVLEAKKV